MDTTYLLHAACGKDGSLETVKQRLQDMKSSSRWQGINARDIQHGRTPLHVACRNASSTSLHRKSLVELLLANGADVNMLDNYRRTPLHYACESHYLLETIVRTLIDAGANINEPDVDGETPLQTACQNTHPDAILVVELLLEVGADVHTTDCAGTSLLHTACFRDIRSKSIMQAIIAAGANVNQLTTEGRTPLHFACSNTDGTHEIIEFLLENGANANHVDEHGYTPLHFYCWNINARPETMRLLVKAGASVNQQKPDGHIPLDIACKQFCNIVSQSDLIRELLELNSKVPERLFKYPTFANVYKEFMREKFLAGILALRKRIPEDLIGLVMAEVDRIEPLQDVS